MKSRYGAVLEPIAVTALHPEVLEAYFGFEVAFARARRLPERMRELVNLKAAALLGCPFCLDIGSSEGSAAGVTEAMIRDLPGLRDEPRVRRRRRRPRSLTAWG